MSALETGSFQWVGPSSDPHDEQLGDVTEPVEIATAPSKTAVFVGEPTDTAVIGRKGAREGPAALRAALSATKTHQFDRGPIGSLGDLGDVLFDPDDGVLARQDRVAEIAAQVYDVGGQPVFLGGDNSLTVGNVRPLLDRGTVGVVSLDAHLDCRAGPPSSGTPYRQLFDAGLDTFAVVGARSFENSTTYAEFATDHGEILSAQAVRRDLDAVVDRVLHAMRAVDRLYLSVDLDVLDASAAPGVSAPTPGGITTRELFDLVRRFAGDSRVAGMEVVECAPPLDVADRTATVGARTIAHVLSQWTTDTNQ